jgi:hypothetical protein
LYLAGPQDADRAIAESKGVPRQNLVAVDWSIKNVELVKSGGVPAIQEDVVEVLRAWPMKRQVSAVLLDFCSGLELDTLAAVANVLLRPPFAQAVVMVNFMRGRDASTNEIRKSVFQHEWMQWVLENPSARHVSTMSANDKNRSAQFLSWAAGCTAASVCRCYGIDHRFLEVLRGVLSFAEPMFYSYRSGALVFDSVVYSNEIASLSVLRECGIEFSVEEVEQLIGRKHAVSRRIGALLAVRSKRLSEGSTGNKNCR